MIQTEWIKLAIDVGLFFSLVLFGLRMVRSSGPRVNLGRMTELEGSLRGLLREADSGSRALTDQLFKRQKDLEKLLFDIETIEGRLNRQITQAEERKGALEIVTSRAESVLRGLERNAVTIPQVAPSAPVIQESLVSEVSHQERPAIRRSSRSEMREARVAAQPAFPVVSEPMVEPPSFAVVMEPRERIPAARKRRLSERVEKEVSVIEEHAQSESVQDSEVLESLGAVSSRAEEARARARDLQRNALFSREPEAEPRTSGVLSPEEARSASIEDPRLGVLTGPVIRRQTQTL